MNSEVVLAVALFLGLLAFYWLTEPEAREQEQKRREQRRRQNVNWWK
ncbi:MAG: hypothetical protein M3347_13895 [Armatimonadota bacterium]|nr:hypothetical protein [Armatimonadota bacterium]